MSNTQAEHDLASPSARAKRLKRLRQLANLSRQDLEKNYGIKYPTLKSWELGNYGGLTRKGAAKLLSIFAQHHVECHLEWLLYGKGAEPSLISSITVLEHDAACSSEAEKELQWIQQELQCFRQHYQHSMVMHVNDDNMTPYFTQGEYIAGVKYYDVVAEQILGRACIVETVDGETLFRVVQKGQSKNKYNLVHYNLASINPVLYNQELISVTPIIWRRQLAMTF
ncbi:MAG: hypothetical protein GKR77_02360 [Legionellales bacterium]|nr:hypothetical protein [Legionellales bacterium]